MVVLAMIFVVGCGDDDDECPTCPTTTVVPATFTNGEVYLQDGSGLYYYTYTYNHGGNSLDMDSIKVDTMSSPVYASYYWNYADPYWYSDFYENEDPSAYDSGDTITVSMYGGGLASTCNIPLLHYSDDEGNITSPSYGTTVSEGATVEAVWNRVDNAEYYAIYTDVYYDSSGTMRNEYNYTFTHDTSYTCPARLTDTTVSYFYCYVMPTTGPDPRTSTGNWTGNLTTGVLYSHGDYDYTRVYVEETPPGVGKATSKENDIAPKVTAWEIIQGVYGLNR